MRNPFAEHEMKYQQEYNNSGAFRDEQRAKTAALGHK